MRMCEHFFSFRSFFRLFRMHFYVGEWVSVNFEICVCSCLKGTISIRYAVYYKNDLLGILFTVDKNTVIESEGKTVFGSENKRFFWTYFGRFLNKERKLTKSGDENTYRVLFLVSVTSLVTT